MSFTTLVTVSELANLIHDSTCAIVDCRFTLDDTYRGRNDYLQSHIPVAVYAHLNEDLSGQIIPGKTGRHPLPPVEIFVKKLSNWGIGEKVQVIAYDDKGGAMAAARFWWMLPWLGHDNVAVLDGGWQQWKNRGYPVTSGSETRKAGVFIPFVRDEMVFSTRDVQNVLHNPDMRLFDSRSVDRYRGENETIDPVAGHIPGALSSPFMHNLDAEGLFLSRQALRERFQKLLGAITSDRAIFYCGSGVTAAHNLLALAHAGMGDARLYAGSWSEWITNPDRPTARGAE